MLAEFQVITPGKQFVIFQPPSDWVKTEARLGFW
jgi:hypothetical protein